MANLKGTKTEKNLLASFAGESQARNRYTYFASVAKKAGFEQIAAVFLETADNEKEHAERFFKFLEGGDVEITASYPAEVEQQHEIRYRKLLKNLKEGEVFKKDTVVKWKCRNCGYVHEGKEAPMECPACAHPQSYYELFCENY